MKRRNLFFLISFIQIIFLNVLLLPYCNAENDGGSQSVQKIGGLINIVSTLHMKGETEQAIEKSYALLECDIKDKNIRYIAAQTIISATSLLYKENRIEESMKLTLQVIDKIPEYGPAYKALGMIYYKNKEYKLAKQYLEKALEKNRTSILPLDSEDQEIENLINLVNDKI